MTDKYLYLDGCVAAGYGPTIEAQAADEIERLCKIESAALLACGVLWMIEHRRGKVKTAFDALRDALGQQCLGEAIQRAIDEGHEADHPPSADWWAGKKGQA